ncbi:hypothetical protein D3C75_556350 [compost metagenome]
MGEVNHEGGSQVAFQHFVRPGSGEMTFTRRCSAHDLHRHFEGKTESLAKYGGFRGKCIQGDAHVVVDELHADTHAWPASFDKLGTHRHQQRSGAFDLLWCAASQ